jgi:two-component system sensor histidine kinase PilS (NtrC family)
VPEEDRQRLLTILTEESVRLDRVLTDFLTYARPRPPDLRPVHLEGCLRDTADLLAGEARAAGVEVAVAVDSDLPPVVADEDLLRQLFWNLLHNGLEAMPGGGRLGIRLGVVEGSGGGDARRPRLWLAVTDSGAGIAPDDLDRLFDPFFTTREHGTGLGLAICHRIVADHGGTIRAASHEGGGACFEVELPVATPLAEGREGAALGGGQAEQTT